MKASRQRGVHNGHRVKAYGLATLHPQEEYELYKFFIKKEVLGRTSQ
jgi:hypothetical protein